MHGFGLVVGGRTSKMLDQTALALKDSRDENLLLRSYVDALTAKTETLEAKVNYLMACRENRQSQRRTTGK